MIKELLKHEIQTICIVHIIAIIFLLIFIMLFVSKARRDRALKAFVTMELGVLFWMVFKILKTVSPNVSMRWAFVVCYYFASIVVELGLLNFTYISFNKKSLSSKAKYTLYIIGIVKFIFVLTNPYHHTFYSYFDFRKDRFGILFPYYIASTYVIVLIAVYYGYKHFRTQIKNKNRVTKIIFSFGVLAPWFLHFIYLKGGFKALMDSFGIAFQFDITPITIAMATSIFVYTTFKFDFDEISPLLRSEIVKNLDSAICVIDSALNVIYVNQKTMNMLGSNAISHIESVLDRKKINHHKSGEYQIMINHKNLVLKFSKVAVVRESQYIITLDDITDYKILEQQILTEHTQGNLINIELKEAIDTLKKESKIEARSFVAKELHDVIGHSLVVAIKSLEVAELYYNKDKNLSKNAIAEAYSALDEGIQSMNKMMNSEQDYKGINLKEEIINKLERIKSLGINYHFNFSGENISLDYNLYNTISKVCQELITNSIKHAKTKNLFLDIRINVEHIMIRYIDNGIGTDNLIEGNGLKGIRERLETIGRGRVDFNSSSGEGFLAKIEIVTSG